nr:hypothetical protein [Tanacetum cinerariifolium]
MVEENDVIRKKKYAEVSAAEKIQADCDMKATNIILQGDDPIACLNKAMAFLIVSFSDEDFSKEIYFNPLFDEEIISMKIDPHHSNDESDLIESLLDHDSSIISSSSKIDSLFDEFAELVSQNSNADVESFSPSPIHVEDSDSFMEEINLSFTPDDPMPPGIEEDDYDSEREIPILEELLDNYSVSLSENESFHFDIPSSSRPPIGTDPATAAGTDLELSAGTDLELSAGTDLERAAGTDLERTAETDLERTVGTDLERAAGTDLERAAVTDLDIYAAGSVSRPPMLNKENYVPWSSRLLRYAKSRPNGKLIHNSILNGPYVRRMIPEQGDANRDVNVNETFHEQTNDELSEKELKKIEADDQVIQTILLGLPEDIYAVVDTDYTQLYDFLKYNQKEVDELKAERLAKIQDPLALVANSNNPYAFSVTHQDQSIQTKLFDTNQQQSKDSSNPRNGQIAQPGMNMGQDRKMQMIRGNGGNQFRQYARQNAGNLNGYNAVQNVGNQVAQNPRVQNAGNQNGQIGVQGIKNQNQIGNGNLVAVRAEGNAAGHNGNQIRCYNCRGKEEAGIQLQAEEYDLMAAAADLDEIKEVNANCILMANL